MVTAQDIIVLVVFNSPRILFFVWKMAHETKLACVAWRFCRAGRTAKPRAAKFARKARENERRSREKNKNKLLPPQSPRGFFALARLYYLARSTKTAMLRRLTKLAPIVTQPGLFL